MIFFLLNYAMLSNDIIIITQNISKKYTAEKQVFFKGSLVIVIIPRAKKKGRIFLMKKIILRKREDINHDYERGKN